MIPQWKAVAPAVKLGLALALALIVSGLFVWPKITTWWYHRQDIKHTAQRDQARAEVKVARKDEAQVTRAGTITAKTVAAQDTHARAQRTATAKDIEAIHERIEAAPAVCLPADDLIVRQRVDQALQRAKGAADRLQGTPGA